MQLPRPVTNPARSRLVPAWPIPRGGRQSQVKCDREFKPDLATTSDFEGASNSLSMRYNFFISNHATFYPFSAVKPEVGIFRVWFLIFSSESRPLRVETGVFRLFLNNFQFYRLLTVSIECWSLGATKTFALWPSHCGSIEGSSIMVRLLPVLPEMTHIIGNSSNSQWLFLS